ncbi:uncharacterized protein [Typha angustifolia]|uniref:uncharacterized protein n=1 Tax=Typha angustifolia TaxID=59011 RepID=UPI003C2EBEA0
MGLLSWWKGNPSSPTPPPAAASSGNGRASGANTEARSREVPGMNGAVEVRRPADVTVFEFGSAVASGDRVTMAGYCPVSDELEPCRWEIIPATGSDAPQVRIVF